MNNNRAVTMFDFQRTILLPIDMQQAFSSKPWPKSWNDKVDSNGLALVAAWRKANLPIIHVRHDSVVSGSSLAPGHHGNSYRPGFEPIEDEPVVVKSVNAAFIGTDLELRLRRLDISRLVIFGIATDMCVSTTVRMASNLGFDVTLVQDACDCFDLPDGNGGTIPAHAVHQAHVATLRFEFCKVVSTAEMLNFFFKDRTAETPS